MQLNVVKENTLVDIYVNNDRVQGVFPSRIEEVKDEILVVAAPISRGTLVRVGNGETIVLTFVQKGCVYNLTTRVVGYRSDPVPVYEVKKNGELTRIQRRNYVRLKTSIPLDFRVVAPEDAASDEKPAAEERGTGISIDISGGGILFITQKKLNTKDLLELRMNLPERSSILIRGRVIRVNPAGHTGNERFQVAVCFTDVKENHRDEIIGFIFKKQRELLKKGLL